MEYSVLLKIDFDGANQELLDGLVDHPEFKDRGAAGDWWEGGLNLRFDVEATTPIAACSVGYMALQRALNHQAFTLRAIESEPLSDLKSKLEFEPEMRWLQFLQTGKIPREWLSSMPEEKPDFIEEGG